MSLTAARMARFRSEIEEEATKGSGKDFIKFPYFTPPANKPIRLRILPGLDPNDPEKDFYVKVMQHYNVSPTKKIPVTCPKTKASGADCPVCQRVSALYKSGNAQDVTEAKYIKARSRYYMGVIPQEGEDAGKIQLWAAPKQIKDAIIGLFATPDYGDITDLKTGRDVYVTKSGEGLNTSYQLLPVPGVTAMSEDADELQALHNAQPPIYLLRNSADLDNIRKYMSGETENILQGFATAPTTAEATGEPEQDSNVYTQVTTTGTTLVSTVVPATGQVDTGVVNTVASSPTPAPAPVPAPVAAPKKFDLASIQAQVAKINKK